MANQNLSQFTEKTFVADADHTFIWDTAASISKRVSRNSWLNSGTLTSDAPVTISQTWGNNLATFKALVVNAAGTSGTNSASGSLLADFQVGGTSLAAINKNGQVIGSTSTVLLNLNSDTYIRNGNAGRAASLWASECRVVGGPLVFSDSVNVNVSDISLGVALHKESANTLALRNGAAAQTFNVYGTWTTAITNFERLAIKYNTTDLAYQIAAEKGTTNGDYRPLQLWTGGASRLHITTAGNVGIGTTNPGSTLTVAGTFHFGANNGLLVGGTTYGGHLGGTQYFSLASTSATSTTIYLQNASSGNKNAVIRVLGSASGADFGVLDISTVDSSPITFGTGLLEKARITASGNVGIGTTSPTSKLQVTGGDVEIETVTSGIIMKAAGTSTRYRITLNATGDALVFTAI